MKGIKRDTDDPTTLMDDINFFPPISTNRYYTKGCSKNRRNLCLIELENEGEKRNHRE